MTPLLALLVTCVPPVVACDGSPLLFPEQVEIVLPYRVRAMRAESFCPRDESGQMQPCAVYLGATGWWSLAPAGDAGEWPMPGCRLLVDEMPDPPAGQVYDVQEPRTCNPAGCSPC